MKNKNIAFDERVIYKNDRYEVIVNYEGKSIFSVIVRLRSINYHFRIKKIYYTTIDGWVWWNPLTWISEKSHLPYFNRGLRKTMDKAISKADELNLKKEKEIADSNLAKVQAEAVLKSREEIESAMDELDRYLTAS